MQVGIRKDTKDLVEFIFSSHGPLVLLLNSRLQAKSSIHKRISQSDGKWAVPWLCGGGKMTTRTATLLYWYLGNFDIKIESAAWGQYLILEKVKVVL